MATNQVYDEARHFPIAVPVGVISGDVVVVGSIVGIAQNDRQTDGTVTIDTGGAHELTVSVAATLGQPVYATVVGGLVTNLNVTAAGNTRIGTALAAQGAAGKIPVKLVQP